MSESEVSHLARYQIALSREPLFIPHTLTHCCIPLNCAAAVPLSPQKLTLAGCRVRCDRVHPCSNCASRGLGTSCVYAPNSVAALPKRSSSSVQDRIKQLENLVLSLMQETASRSHTSPSDPLQLPSEAMHSHTNPTPSESGYHEPRAPPSRTDEIQRPVSPSPSDHGNISIQKSAVSYVSSAHWAAVLDSIAGLRDHFEQDDESHNLGSGNAPAAAILSRALICYVVGARHACDPAAILDSLPPRSPSWTDWCRDISTSGTRLQVSTLMYRKL